MKQLITQAKNSKFSQNSFTYIIVAVISSGLTFVLITILTHYLSKKDFGIIENFLAFSTLVTSLLLWGGDTLIINYYSEKGDKNEFKNAFNNVLTQSVILFVLAIFLNFSFLGFSKWTLIAACFYTVFNALYSLIITSFQLEGKAIKYGITTISFSIVNFAISVPLAIFLQNYLARVLGLLGSVVLVFIVIFIPFYKSRIRPDYSFKFPGLKYFYILGIPLVFSQLSSWFIERSDRFLISGMLDLEKLGVYGLGVQFGMIVLVIQSAISRAWLPYLIDKVQIGQRESIKKTILFLTILMFVITVMVCVAIYFYITIFLNPVFHEAAWIAIIVSFGYFFDGLWKLYNGILIYENNFKFYSGLVAGIGFLKIGINVLIIPLAGIIGAAFSTVLTFFIGFMINFLYVHYKLNWFKISSL